MDCTPTKVTITAMRFNGKSNIILVVRRPLLIGEDEIGQRLASVEMLGDGRKDSWVVPIYPEMNTR